MEQHRKFGMQPVFFTAISTILGAILFLRFGYGCGYGWLLGRDFKSFCWVIPVTIPTALAISLK